MTNNSNTERDNELAQLRAEIARLKANQNAALRFTISRNGCVEFNGIRGQYCPRLDLDECEKIINSVDALKAFIEENRSRIVTTVQRKLNRVENASGPRSTASIAEIELAERVPEMHA